MLYLLTKLTHHSSGPLVFWRLEDRLLLAAYRGTVQYTLLLVHPHSLTKSSIYIFGPTPSSLLPSLLHPSLPPLPRNFDRFLSSPGCLVIVVRDEPQSKPNQDQERTLFGPITIAARG